MTGHVQGVGYRYFAARTARLFGVTGSVRNLPDGGVEVVVEGERERVLEFAARLRQGPGGARVEDLQLVWGPAGGRHTTFSIEP